MASNSIRVPNTDIVLVDGSVVMLARFPGTKWVVHSGWYTYNGSQYTGWYFCSIPAQTVIPVNEEDLTLLTVVSNGPHHEGMPVPPPPGPHPHPHPHPYPPGPPVPPMPPFPPYPPGPGPTPEAPAYFSVKSKAALDAAFITVANLKHRDTLFNSTDDIPDGKIVRVNSVNGETVYYIWNKYLDEWMVFDPIGEALEGYATTERVDEVEAASQERDAVLTESVETLAEESQIHSDKIDELESTVEGVQTNVDVLSAKVDEFRVKDFETTGEGDYVHSVELDPETGMLTATLGSAPAMSKGEDIPGESVILEPGQTFDVSVGTDIAGTELSDIIAQFTLPVQIESVALGPGSNKQSISVITSMSNGVVIQAEHTVLEDFATEQELQDALAEIGNPMHFIGISTFPITDGGRELPIIDGVEIYDLNKGDVVIYQKKEFVWSGSYWYELGDLSQLDVVLEKAKHYTDVIAAGLQEQIDEIVVEEVTWDVEDGASDLEDPDEPDEGGGE